MEAMTKLHEQTLATIEAARGLGYDDEVDELVRGLDDLDIGKVDAALCSAAQKRGARLKDCDPTGRAVVSAAIAGRRWIAYQLGHRPTPTYTAQASAHMLDFARELLKDSPE